MCIRDSYWRHHSFTEVLWQKISKLMKFPHLRRSDQTLFNYGLIALGITWQRINGTSFHGECGNSTMVSTIPPSLACLARCSNKIKDSVYIWHALSRQVGQAKVKSASRSGTMFLLSQWTTICNGNSLVGVQWLQSQCISGYRL